MKTGRFWVGGLLALAIICAPLASYADFYKRDGGGAYHSTESCPALHGYKVVVISNNSGLTPCRICCKTLYDHEQQQENVAYEGMKTDQPRALTIQDMSGTNAKKAADEAAEAAATADYYGYYGDGGCWDPIQWGPGGPVVVSNGQVLHVGPGAHVGGPVSPGGFHGGGPRGGGGRR